MTGRAVLAPQAEGELRAIADAIDQNNPQAARRLRRLVGEAAQRIGTRPLLGRAEPRLARPHIRFWSLPAFSLLIAYDPDEEPVQILRIVHTARDLPKVLKDLRS